MARRATQALARLDLKLDVWQELSSCSIAVQQMVAIARALDTSAKLLILDEPTSSLDTREVAELFTVMRRLRDRRVGHRVRHAFSRPGVCGVRSHHGAARRPDWWAHIATAELPRLQLVSKMIGRDVAEIKHAVADAAPKQTGTSAVPLVEARQLGRSGSTRPMDFEIDKGEVIGLAGLLGSGRTETARLLFGVDRADTGEVLLDG